MSDYPKLPGGLGTVSGPGHSFCSAVLVQSTHRTQQQGPGRASTRCPSPSRAEQPNVGRPQLHGARVQPIYPMQ